MLIARAPVRLSLAGGGTDLPSYYERFGGAVISTTIDKYFYVFLTVDEAVDLQITSSDYRTFYRHNGDGPLLWDGDLSLPRAVLHHFGVSRGVRMFLASEIPPGTGLGSSSAVCVALIKAVSTAVAQRLSRQEIAELACEIEIHKLGNPIGKQDQFAPAFGGLNEITFTAQGVGVKRLPVDPETRRELERNLMLFFTGEARNSSMVLAEQNESSKRSKPQVLHALHAIKAMVADVRDCLERSDLRGFGHLLHENWMQKKQFASKVSNPFVDECYEAARSNGALGGKLTGAGGGGFLMVYCEGTCQRAVSDALEGLGLKRLDYRFDNNGVRLLMNAGHQLTIMTSVEEHSMAAIL